MSEEIKSTLLIHIETNRSFIQEKVYEEFRLECVRDLQLKDINIDKMVRVMKQIFDFGENNPLLKEFLSSAHDNIQRFIQNKYKKTSEMQDLTINIDLLVEMIYACVEGGFTKVEQIKKEIKEEIKQQIIVQNPEVKQVIEPFFRKQAAKVEPPPQPPAKKFYVPKPKTPEKKNFIQKFQMPEKQMPARYLMQMVKQAKKQEQVVVAEVSPLDLDYIQRNKRILDNRLLNLFKFYCSQQQGIGKHSTFDRIKQQCQQMTIGKFLIFCKTVKLFEQKELTKQILIGKFRQVSEGKKQIQFEQFKKLIATIDEDFVKIRKKTLGQNAQIATYEARLMLQGNQYKNLMKDVELPFTTRQKQGRQLKNRSTIDVNRNEDLTPHSGKFIKDIKQEIQRKQTIQSSSKNKNKGQESEKPKKPKIVRLQNLRYQDLPGMEWVLKQQQNDKTFFQKYRSKDVIGSLKKRVTDLQKMQRSKAY